LRSSAARLIRSELFNRNRHDGINRIAFFRSRIVE
jgi:hypothetical protein